MATVPILLSQLVQRISVAQNLTTCLNVFRSAKFAVDSWATGGGFHTMTSALAEGITELSDTVVEIATGAYIDLASGTWLKLLAKSWFDIDKREASYCYQTLRLTSAVGSPPYTITAGQVWASTSADLRFNNTTGGVLASGGTLDVTVKAESPGATYNVGTSTVTTLVTALPGVTCTNIAMVTRGLDAETDTELRTRCRLKWPGFLASYSTGGRYEFWALTEPDGVTARSGVTRAYADIYNPGGAGTIYVYLAGPDGAVDAGVIADADTDLQTRIGPSTVLTTLSASETTITPVGTIWVDGVLPADAQSAAETALDTMVASLPIGGRNIGGDRGVFEDELAATIRGISGVVRVYLTSGDHTLTENQVAVGAWTSLTWSSV